MLTAVIAGVDPSSKKLAVVIDHQDGRVTTHRWVAEAKKWEPTNCQSAHRWVITEFRHTEPGIVWFEEPLMGRGGVRTSVVQAFTSGAAQAAFLELGWQVRLVNVQRWKAEVVGNGHASKDDVAATVAERWPDVVGLGDPDLNDAGGICLYGRGVLARAAELGMES